MVQLLNKLSSTCSALARAVNIEDLRQLARKRAPRPVFDYVDGGADGEVTSARQPSELGRNSVPASQRRQRPAAGFGRFRPRLRVRDAVSAGAHRIQPS